MARKKKVDEFEELDVDMTKEEDYSEVEEGDDEEELEFGASRWGDVQDFEEEWE